MLTQPGKKLTFMSSEFGQRKEWDYRHSIDWHLLESEEHRRLLEYTKSANAYYLSHPALWEQDGSWDGFRWLCVDDEKSDAIVYLRQDTAGASPLMVACNFSARPLAGFRVGIPFGSTWAVDFSSDDPRFGGQGRENSAPIRSEHIPTPDFPQSVSLDIPPLSCVIYRCVCRYPRQSSAKIAPAPPAEA
jgi:1,4-alpha-glucan branching enzyme